MGKCLSASGGRQGQYPLMWGLISMDLRDKIGPKGHHHPSILAMIHHEKPGVTAMHLARFTK